MKKLTLLLCIVLSSIISVAQIAGDTAVCSGSIYNYNANIVGAISYQWTFPSGWYDITGQGTTTASATCNINAGNICVEGFDALNNSLGTICLTTQFGGGSAVGWDVQPQNSISCAGNPYVLNIVPNGSGGGSCPNGCGNGTTVLNTGYAVYDDIWPLGNFIGFADGSYLSYPPNPGSYFYYIYFIDFTDGTSTSQAVRIEGGCGSASVNNVAQLTIPIPTLPSFYQLPNPVCIGDTVTISETSGATNGSYSPVMGITILSVSGGVMTAVVNSMPARASYVGLDWNGCVTSDLCYINVCAPSTLPGDTTVCAGNTYAYTANISGAISYQWLFPTGWYDITGQGTANVSATCNANAGWITVSGLDIAGNIVGVENLLTQFGGGGGAGWDVAPSYYANCILNPVPFFVTINSNGTGGGSCPAGCGSGSQHPNIVYAVYNNVWPSGLFVGYADGITPIQPPTGVSSTYFVYLVDVSNGLDPPQAILISGGCGGGVVNNSISLPVIWPIPPIVSSIPNPACIGDTITVTENSGLINGFWNVSNGGTIYNNNISSIELIVTGNPCDVYIEGIDMNTGCFTFTNYNVPVINCLAGSITGDTTVCAGYTYNYSAAIPGAVSYQWSFPSGWYGIIGQGTSSVSATCNVNDGDVCVEGFDALGNSLGIECITTEFGGGGASGWDVFPQASTKCVGLPTYFNIIPNGTGGGPGCPAGCGNGTLHPNLQYCVYDNVWPTGNWVAYADGSAFFTNGGVYYVYYCDVTNGNNPPQAVRIEGGCGTATVNNVSTITAVLPYPPNVVQTPINSCIGDTIVFTESTGISNPCWSCVTMTGLTLLTPQFSTTATCIITSLPAEIDVSGIDGNGCLTYGLYQVTFGICNAPVISFASSDTVFCDKQSIDFFDFSSNNPTSWQWTFTGATPSSSTDQNPVGIYYAANGSFDVSLISCNANGCDTLTIPAFIIEYAAPVAPVVTGNSGTLYCTASTTYAWYSTANPTVILSTDSFYVPAQTGSYYVVTTDANGCEATSNVFVITGLNLISNSDFNVQVINDFNAEQLQLIIIQNQNRELKISVCDVTGKVFLTKVVGGDANHGQPTNTNQGQTSEQYSIDVSSLAAGIYFVTVESKEQKITKKFFVW